jgi:hypothetical protein
VWTRVGLRLPTRVAVLVLLTCTTQLTKSFHAYRTCVAAAAPAPDRVTAPAVRVLMSAGATPTHVAPPSALVSKVFDDLAQQVVQWSTSARRTTGGVWLAPTGLRATMTVPAVPATPAVPGAAAAAAVTEARLGPSKCSSSHCWA